MSALHRDRWFTEANILQVLKGPPPSGWPHVKTVDEAFPRVFDQRQRPDFVWDIFGPPTDLKPHWSANGDLKVTWEPARAVIEVKAIKSDLYDRLQEFKPGTCATPLDYLAMKLKPSLVKANRQIRAARGLIAGQESLGVLVLINEESDSLKREDVISLLDRSLRDYLPSIDLIVYLHDWCVRETSHGRRPDGTLVQLHRVSFVGDPSKVLNRLFVNELKRVLEIAFRPGNLEASGTVRSKTYEPGRPMSKTVTTAQEGRDPQPGQLWFDPEGQWGSFTE